MVKISSIPQNKTRTSKVLKYSKKFINNNIQIPATSVPNSLRFNDRILRNLSVIRMGTGYQNPAIYTITEHNPAHQLLITTAKGKVEIIINNDRPKIGASETIRIVDPPTRVQMRPLESPSIIIIDEELPDDIPLLKSRDNLFTNRLRAGASSNTALNKVETENYIIIAATYGSGLTGELIPVRIGIKSGSSYHEKTLNPRARVASLHPEVTGIQCDDIDFGVEEKIIHEWLMEITKRRMVVGFQPALIFDYFRVPMEHTFGIRDIYGQLTTTNENVRQTMYRLTAEVHTVVPKIKTTKIMTQIMDEIYRRYKPTWIDEIDVSFLLNTFEYVLTHIPTESNNASVKDPLKKTHKSKEYKQVYRKVFGTPSNESDDEIDQCKRRKLNTAKSRSSHQPCTSFDYIEISD